MTMIGRHSVFLRIGRALAALVSPRTARCAPFRAPWVVGHRGAAREAAENTIESFARAAEAGADAVEADICVTQDGHFVVWHDADPGSDVALARQAGRENLCCTPDVPTLGSRWRRAVAELTFTEFHRHYGYTARRGGLADLIGSDGPPDIPAITLAELFAWADREHRVEHVFLDVKLEPRQADRAIELLEIVRERTRRGVARRDLIFHYLSPHREILEALVARCRKEPLPSQIRVHADFELPGVLSAVREIGTFHVSMGVGQRFWNEFREEVSEVVAARERGEVGSVVVWTISDPKRLRDLVRMGVDGILTDDPAGLRAIVSEQARCAASYPTAGATV